MEEAITLSTFAAASHFILLPLLGFRTKAALEYVSALAESGLPASWLAARHPETWNTKSLQSLAGTITINDQKRMVDTYANSVDPSRPACLFGNPGSF
jgi:hypothetical protein